MILLISAILASTSAAQAAPPVPPAEAEAFMKCARDQGVEKSVCQALAAQMSGQFASAAGHFEAGAAQIAHGDAARGRMLAAAGNMWIAAGEPDKAALALEKALSGGGLLADQRGEALIDRARAAEAQGDLKTARAKLTEAAGSAGDDSFFWYFSAALAVRENDPARALQSINRALALEPADPMILFEAGHVHHFAGDTAKARDYWTRAAAADPNGEHGAAAKRALAMLDVPLVVQNGAAPTK